MRQVSNFLRFHNEESVDMNNSQILHLYFLFEIVFIQ